MCYHRLYIFTLCGHSCFQAEPLRACRDASFAPDGTQSVSCQPCAHPLHSYKLARPCMVCQLQTEMRLREVEQLGGIRFDEWRWKVSLATPSARAKSMFAQLRDASRYAGDPKVLRAGYRERRERTDESLDENRWGVTSREPLSEVLVIPAPRPST